MAERFAWGFLKSGPTEAPPLKQVLKRALAQRLREWATEVLEEAEGATISSPSAPGPSAPSSPGPREKDTLAAAVGVDESGGDGPPAAWLDYIRERAPHLVVGGRFRPLRAGDLLPPPSAAPPALQARNASGGNCGATPSPAAQGPSNSGPTTGMRDGVAAGAETGPLARARADADTGVWPRRHRRAVAADATNVRHDRAEAAAEIAATPVVVDTGRSVAARGPEPLVPPPDDRARAVAPDVPAAVSSPPRPRLAGEPAARVVEGRSRRAENAPAPGAPEIAREPSVIARRPRPVWPTEPADVRAVARAPVAREAARLQWPREIAAPTWPALANSGVGRAIATRPSPTPPAAPPAPPARHEPTRRESALEARDSWPSLPSLSLSLADQVAGDLEAPERRERLRREQMGAP